jgi:accessory colonization factor AcfC
VSSFRANIATVAANSAQAKQEWMNDKSTDASLIWTI